MNKKIILPILCVGLVLSSCGDDNAPYNPPHSESYFPIQEVKDFLLERGTVLSDDVLPNSLTSVTTVVSSYRIDDEEYPHYQVSIDFEDSDYNQIISELNTLNWDLSGDIFIDSNLTIGLEIYKNDNFIINIYSYNDLIEIPPEEDEEKHVDEFVLYTLIGNEDKLESKDVSPFTPTGHTDFIFNFYKNDSSYSPKSNNGSTYKCVALYASNSMSIETVSSTYTIKKIELTTAGRNGEISSDVGSVSQDDLKVAWTGEANKITFTAAAQYRFDNIKIEYYIPILPPIPEGIKTIGEIRTIADGLIFTGTDGYLVNNDYKVEVLLEAIDGIDSVSTSGGIDPNSRGKVLCADETGYILCSSSTVTSSTIPFYRRVSEYIKDNKTTYYVKGHLAKFNGVLEINVEEYKYRSDLSFDYDLNNFVNSESTDSSSFMNSCKSIISNKNGYGFGKLARLNALTCFNIYDKKAGSYYFLDQLGKLLPLYSWQNKDRSSLVVGKVYDIIGVETLHRGRPSLRILKVINNLGADPASLDFSNAINKDSTKYFYNVNESNSTYQEEFYNSVTTVYKMDVNVSSYGVDKYTFNENVYYDLNDKVYTTGITQEAAANHYSLGIFNDDLDYKQILLDFLVSNAQSLEECEALKITLYFTLAYLDTVNGKKMWRVNIFEDLVFGLDYYESSSESIDFTSLTPNHDETKQWYQSSNIKVTNASTSLNNYSYSTYYLKVVDGTSLTIEFNQPIIAFTLYHKTYSYIAGIGELEIMSYRQFSKYTVFLLAEPSKTIEINNFAVSGNRNNAYLGIESLTVNY